MYAEQSLELSDVLKERIRTAIEDVNEAGVHRPAPRRYNKTPTATERNAFTSAVVKEVTWLNSPEGRKRATNKGHHEESVLYDLIDIAMSNAIDSGMSPLQVLYFGLYRTMAQHSFPDDFKLVTEFIATILAEGERQYSKSMTLVTYRKPDKTRVERKIRKWFEALESEYWRGVGRKTPFDNVRFSSTDDAALFKSMLQELQIEVVENPVPDN